VIQFFSNTKIYTNNDFVFSFYAQLINKFHLRFHKDNNKIFSIGIENLGITRSKEEQQKSNHNISLYGLYGFKLNEDYKLITGVHLGHNKEHPLLYHKYLLGLKSKTFTGFVETSFINKKVLVEDK